MIMTMMTTIIITIDRACATIDLAAATFGWPLFFCLVVGATSRALVVRLISRSSS